MANYAKSTTKRIARLVKQMEIAIMTLAAAGFWLYPTAPSCYRPFSDGRALNTVRTTEILGAATVSLARQADWRQWPDRNGYLRVDHSRQVAGTLFITPDQSRLLLIAALLLCALGGYASARGMPAAVPSASRLVIDWNFLRQTWRIVQHARQNRTVWLSLMGISWFWFLGATYLSKLPSYASDVLHGDATVYTLLMTLFSVGVGIGSVLCDKPVRPGKWSWDWFRSDQWDSVCSASTSTCCPLPPRHSGLERPAGQSHHWRLMADFTLIGVFGGFTSYRFAPDPDPDRTGIPLKSDCGQQHCQCPVHGRCSRIRRTRCCRASITEVLLACALLEHPVAAYIYLLLPEFLMRSLIWLITHTMYRVHRGLEPIPDDGPVVLVCKPRQLHGCT